MFELLSEHKELVNITRPGGSSLYGPLHQAAHSGRRWRSPSGRLRVTAKGQPMWVFTKHGFFSAVCARKSSGEHGQPVDPDRIMVRARLRGHLEALKEQFSELLGHCEIQQFAGSDYAFRIFVGKSVWSQVLAGLAEETNYDNFKSEVARHQGSRGAAYEHALHQIWSVMNRLQK